MNSKLVQIDTPNNLVLSDLERKIIEGLASNRSPKDLVLDLGIPRNAIMNLMRKEGVSEFIQELIDARNQLMKIRLSDLLMGIIDDKVLRNSEDEERRLADLSSKDIMEIIKTANDLIKTSGSEKKEAATDAFKDLYIQIQNIQNTGDGK